MSVSATLIVMEGLPDQAGQVFEVGAETTTLGRGLGCDIQLADRSISRLHAEFLWQGDELFLIHKSQVNRTLVNGVEVQDRQRLVGGEEIQFADRVVLRVKIESDVTAARPDLVPPVVSLAEPASKSAPIPLENEPSGLREEAPPLAAGSPERIDVTKLRLAIIGAGPAGIAAAVRAAERGIEHVLYERSVLANTIVKYQKGKLVMAEPAQLPLQADLKVVFEEAVREQILEWWSDAVAGVGVELMDGCEILSIEGEKGAFKIQARDGGGARTIEATHIVLAIGVQGDLRKFGVPGDDQPWVTYQLDDPQDHQDKRVVVVGVGDAGIENALALAENGNDVTVVNRRKEIDRAKPMNRAAIEAKIKSGEINYLTNASADRFETDAAVFRTTDGAEARVECDLVIGRLGATPPRTFLENIGVEFSSSNREAIPDVSEHYESNVPGLYMVGALVGYPLIKNCLNQGYEVVEHILGEPVKPADEPVLAAKFRDVDGSVSEVLDRIRRTLPAFGPLTSVQLRSLMFESKLRVEEAGVVLYRRADFDNSFFSVLEGEVELTFLDNSDSTISEESRPQRKSSRGPGQFFGEDGLISGRRRGETVVTKSRCVLVETPRNAMTKLIRSVEEVRKVIDGAYVHSALMTLFPSLAPGKRKRLAYRAEILTHRAGAVIFKEGDEPDGLHLIRRGTVELYKLHEGVEEQIDSIRAGSTIGETALTHAGRRRSATARASVDCETVCFPTELMLSLVESEKEIREYLERREQEFILSSVRRQHGRGTMMWLQKSGGNEATDLLMIDETLCIRCDNCEKACAETHGGVSRLNREAGATYMTTGGSALHLPTACQHCENPKCMTDCPPDALNRDPNGEVWINDEICIGCGNCESYCPYNVIKMATVDNDPGPGLLMRLMFPKRAVKLAPAPVDAAASVKKAVKCDLCRALPKKRSGEPRAACVASCPTGAIVRIDPDEYADEIYERQG
ncbi:MAG: NAD(P)-binding domain-containing protein [Myxococcota bacterium]